MSALPALPRAAWLAIGAIVAALLVADVTAPGVPSLALLGASAITTAAAIGLARRRRAGPAALLLGLGSVGLRAAVVAVIGGAAVTAALPAGDGEWQATVVDVSSPSGTEQRAFIRLGGSEATRSSWTIYSWLPRHPAVVPGDILMVAGRLEAPPEDGSGFADFLASRGAEGTLRARSMRLLAGGGGFSASVERLRWGIDATLSRALPEPEAGLAAGILIGLRERVSRAVADDFTTTGLIHVVAISGWNIALVAGIATGLLRATGLGRRLRSVIVIAAIVGYTILAGAEASVIRAAVMGGVVLVAREGGRPSGAAAALGVACWALLLAEPRMITDIGLQLSLAATAGLLVMGRPAEATVRRVMRGKAPRWFCETLGISLAAQLATLPLILLHFGRFSLISPLANLLVAPVVPTAMLGAFVGVLIGPLLVGPLASLIVAPVTLAAWLPLTLMVRGAHLLAGVPLANLELVAPFDLAGALVATLLLLVVLRRVRSRTTESSSPSISERATGPPAGDAPRAASGHRALAVILAVILVAGTSVVLITRPSDPLRITVFDIGQGDAILLEAGDGSRMLIDGGPDPDLLVRRLDERIPIWDRRIDLVLLTHPHEDHSSGLAGLLPRYRIAAIAETGMASDGAGVSELRALSARSGLPRTRLVQGDEFMLGDATISVLWPPRDAIPEVEPSSGRVINNTSIVLRVSIGRQRLLLTGDLEDDKDELLLEAIGTDGRSWDLLKVAHHGSATATSQRLLEALRPRLAVISSGSDNPYGHPAASTMARLDSVGTRLWRTDVQGTFSLTFDGRIRSASSLLSERSTARRCAASPSETLDEVEAARACYARRDGGPHSNRSLGPAHILVALGPALPARYGGSRGSLDAGLPCYAGRRFRRPATGGHRRAPP
ncbi:MAG: DNA internalization-related competence protein ComEC/Rec2, partial [Chloroflexota bacterium]